MSNRFQDNVTPLDAATARHKIGGCHKAAAKGDELLFVLLNRSVKLLVFIEFINISGAFTIKSCRRLV